MPADYSRIHRLLKILTLIQGSSDWTAGRLALECQTAQRTIYRDLKMLQGAGIPYFYDDQKKCYSIRRDFFLPPVQLTLEEALSLVSLAGEVGANEQVPFMATATKAIEKVRGQLPQSIREELDQIAPHVAIKLAAAGSADGLKDVYQLVRSALAGKRALLCRYESLRHAAKGDGKTEAEEFLFKPYALLFSQRAWYAVGHHGGRKAVRTL
ncbi:MAG: WYL domain-containing protein, partial [Betaproteobacteria bacterium]|nr:WYL domain-containing protein [Betaproteobacteria bacterium]